MPCADEKDARGKSCVATVFITSSNTCAKMIFFSSISNKSSRGNDAEPSFPRLFLLFQADDLLMQHHKFLLHNHILMVVPEEPVFETAAFPDVIEKVRQSIPLVQSAAECILDAAGAAVGYVIFMLTYSGRLEPCVFCN